MEWLYAAGGVGPHPLEPSLPANLIARVYVAAALRNSDARNNALPSSFSAATSAERPSDGAAAAAAGGITDVLIVCDASGRDRLQPRALWDVSALARRDVKTQQPFAPSASSGSL